MLPDAVAPPPAAARCSLLNRSWNNSLIYYFFLLIYTFGRGRKQKEPLDFFLPSSCLGRCIVVSVTSTFLTNNKLPGEEEEVPWLGWIMTRGRERELQTSQGGLPAHELAGVERAAATPVGREVLLQVQSSQRCSVWLGDAFTCLPRGGESGVAPLCCINHALRRIIFRACTKAGSWLLLSQAHLFSLLHLPSACGGQLHRQSKEEIIKCLLEMPAAKNLLNHRRELP